MIDTIEYCSHYVEDEFRRALTHPPVKKGEQAKNELALSIIEEWGHELVKKGGIHYLHFYLTPIKRRRTNDLVPSFSYAHELIMEHIYDEFGNLADLDDKFSDENVERLRDEMKLAARRFIQRSDIVPSNFWQPIRDETTRYEVKHFPNKEGFPGGSQPAEVINMHTTNTVSRDETQEDDSG